MAKTEKHDATILPIHVRGTVSPYPIVVTVICTQLPDNIDIKPSVTSMEFSYSQQQNKLINWWMASQSWIQEMNPIKLLTTTTTTFAFSLIS